MSAPYPLTPRPPGAWGRSGYPRDRSAVAGVVIGIVAVLVNPFFITSIVGFVLSVRARGRALDEGNRELATGGLVLNVTAAAIAVLEIILAIFSVMTTVGLCLAGSSACGLN
jgi:hypothetical protein